ncbi:MAG: STAS domain-containing protein [Rhodospirillaceae bacterium]
MQISVLKEGYVTVAAVQGRVDSTSSEEVEKRVVALLQRGEKRLVLDLSGVDYMASVGLRVLLTAAKKSSAVEARLVLAAPTDFVREILTMTGFLNYFEVFDSATAAVAALKD